MRELIALREGSVDAPAGVLKDGETTAVVFEPFAQRIQPSCRAMTQRAAIYLRVSTDLQTVDNQRPGLEQLARDRHLIILTRYEEAVPATRRRPVFARMMATLRGGAFDVLLVWSLDRFGRSMAGNVNDALAPRLYGRSPHVAH